MSERFPEIDWYCDRCNAYLNDQSGFDDHHYVWKCTECGHKNSISSDSSPVGSSLLRQRQTMDLQPRLFQ